MTDFDNRTPYAIAVANDSQSESVGTYSISEVAFSNSMDMACVYFIHTFGNHGNSACLILLEELDGKWTLKETFWIH